MATTQLNAEHLFTITAELGDSSNAFIKGGPQGTRTIASVTGGHFDGPRLKGTIVPPGGDWVTNRADRSIRLDVRILLVTDDDESILMTYNGVGQRNKDGTMSLRTAPTFETGADQYAWLNHVQAVGIGVAQPGSVTYEVYAIE